MSRKFIDCREMPSLSNCSIVMVGEPEELMRLAVFHAQDVHGHPDTPELREGIRKGMRDEPQAWASVPVQKPGGEATMPH